MVHRRLHVQQKQCNKVKSNTLQKKSQRTTRTKAESSGLADIVPCHDPGEAVLRHKLLLPLSHCCTPHTA